MQEYANQLGHCLMDLQLSSSQTAVQQLRTWVLELHFLHVAVALYLPYRLKEVIGRRYDTGQVCSPNKYGFYNSLLVCT